MAKKCIYCGREISEDSNFCMYCGKSQTQTEPEIEDIDAQPPLSAYLKESLSSFREKAGSYSAGAAVDDLKKLNRKLAEESRPMREAASKKISETAQKLTEGQPAKKGKSDPSGKQKTGFGLCLAGSVLTFLSVFMPAVTVDSFFGNESFTYYDLAQLYSGWDDGKSSGATMIIMTLITVSIAILVLAALKMDNRIKVSAKWLLLLGVAELVAVLAGGSDFGFGLSAAVGLIGSILALIGSLLYLQTET